MEFDKLDKVVLDDIYERLRLKEEMRKRALYCLNKGVCPSCARNEIDVEHHQAYSFYECKVCGHCFNVTPPLK